MRILKILTAATKGDGDMRRKSLLNILASLLVFAVLPVLFSGPAAGTSYVYDPFTTVAIPAPGSDPNWVDVGPKTGLFSMPGDGSLYFSDPSPGGNNDALESSGPNGTISGAFFLSMQYSITSVSNTEPLGVAGVGSSVQLLLGSSSNGVRISAFNQGATPSNPAGTYQINGATLQGGTVTRGTAEAASASGWLGIYYNGVAGSGGQATVWYNTGTVWTQLGGPGYILYPDLAGNPSIAISGVDADGNYLSFNVSDLTISTTAFPDVPLPSSLLPLATGLVGLVTMRRRLKK